MHLKYVQLLPTVAPAQMACWNSSVLCTHPTYSLLIAQQLLLGVLPRIVLSVFYFVWRFLVAVETIADALQQLAHQREQDR